MEIDISKQAMQLGKYVEKVALDKGMPVVGFCLIFSEAFGADKTMFNYSIHFQPTVEGDIREEMTQNLEAIISTMGDTYEAHYQKIKGLH